MSVGPWAVSFSALVPLHESHSESGRLMNYSCSPAVTIHQYDSITKKTHNITLHNNLISVTNNHKIKKHDEGVKI